MPTRVNITTINGGELLETTEEIVIENTNLYNQINDIAPEESVLPIFYINSNSKILVTEVLKSYNSSLTFLVNSSKNKEFLNNFYSYINKETKQYLYRQDLTNNSNILKEVLKIHNFKDITSIDLCHSHVLGDTLVISKELQEELSKIENLYQKYFDITLDDKKLSIKDIIETLKTNVNLIIEINSLEELNNLKLSKDIPFNTLLFNTQVDDKVDKKFLGNLLIFDKITKFEDITKNYSEQFKTFISNGLI